MCAAPCHGVGMAVGGKLEAGQDALARGAWAEAASAFEAALATAEDGIALEGLATACWWLDDAERTLAARERAFRRYRRLGDSLGAGRVATSLAWDSILFGGREVVGRGWLDRARRLLEPLAAAPEHGWLAVREAELALRLERDPIVAREHAARAAEIGRTLGKPDLEVVGLALEGLALVNAGEVHDGMRRLDEAVAAATAGEVPELMWVGKVCCFMIYACEGARDYDRASQWCEEVSAFCRRWDLQPLFSVCRTQYASVLIARGVWDEAEHELESVLGGLGDSRREVAMEGVARLGELRRRQGRLDEAASLFAQAHEHPLARLGRAELSLARGDAATCAEVAETLLRRTPVVHRLARVGALELLVRAEVARHRPEAASPAVAELADTAAAVGTEPLRAAALFAQGLVAAATGDLAHGRRLLSDAAELYARSGSAYEAARADAEAMRRGQEAPLQALTRRESEVLRLVARGLSNREIAAELVLSEHTVHRHVANILRKLAVPTRAAASAAAIRLGV